MAEEEKTTAKAKEPEKTKKPKYLKEALFLAENYTRMLEERAWLKRRIAGNWTYTKEMAIAELDSITVAYDHERVQSSNISNPTERIAMKLTAEYLAQKQAEMNAERDTCIAELDYLEWKIGVVETVWHERAIGIHKSVFQLLFYQHKTFKEAENALLLKKKRKVYDCGLVTIKEKLWMLFDKEIDFCFQNEAERRFVERLTADVNSEFVTMTEETEEEGIDEQTKRKTS